MDIYIDIGGWGGYEKNVALPIKWNSLLDERLDECILNINNVTDSIFRIGDEVKIFERYRTRLETKRYAVGG